MIENQYTQTHEDSALRLLACFPAVARKAAGLAAATRSLHACRCHRQVAGLAAAACSPAGLDPVACHAAGLDPAADLAAAVANRNRRREEARTGIGSRL
ncbi:unnamed protein product [Urochloa humidicola]